MGFGSYFFSHNGLCSRHLHPVCLHLPVPTGRVGMARTQVSDANVSGRTALAEHPVGANREAVTECAPRHLRLRAVQVSVPRSGAVLGALGLVITALPCT